MQRVQIIKGWVDSDGQTHEQVFDIAGNADNGAGIDPNSCRRLGQGLRQSCTVWQDPQFSADQDSFYYVRVLENPSCRWSTRHCLAAGVNPFAKNCRAQADELTASLQENRGAKGDVYGNCCKKTEEEPFYSPVIQERAWSSSIWYTPQR